jgi:hypothetical protein
MPEDGSPTFGTISELHAYVEDNARKYDHLYPVGRLFQTLRDALYLGGKSEEALHAQIELDALSFFLNEGNLRPMFQGTTQDGKATEYPSITRFDATWIDYLRTRISASRNPILLARYAHIGWMATGEVGFATGAISNYLLAAREYEKSDINEPDKFYSLSILESLLAAGNLSLSIGSDILPKVTEEMVRVIQLPKDRNRGNVHLLLSLSRYLLSKRKKLGRSGLAECLSSCTEEYRRQVELGDYHTAIDLIELCRRLELSLGKQPLNWEAELGKNYESLASLDEYDNFARVSFVEDAILHYRKAKLPEKAEALHEKLMEARKKTHFGQVTSSVDLGPQLKECDRVARLVCDGGFEYVARYLMYSRDILPDYDALVESVDKNSPLQKVIPSAIVDSLGNTVRHFSSDDEKKYFAVLQHCGMVLDTTSHMLVRAILFEALRRGILTGPLLSDYLLHNSWIGKEIDTEVGNSVETHRWIDQVIPALNDYFVSMEMHLKNPLFRPSLVECIDSLATKFEGLVRDICKLSGVNTIEIKEDHGGRTTSSEKDLHALLYEPSVSQLFDKTDLLFLRYLLVEQAGYCIRHKVAHSQMKMADYRLKIYHYLLLALLRICRYDLKAKADSPAF